MGNVSRSIRDMLNCVPVRLENFHVMLCHVNQLQTLKYLKSGSKLIEKVNSALTERNFSSLSDRVLLAMVTLGEWALQSGSF